MPTNSWFLRIVALATFSDRWRSKVISNPFTLYSKGKGQHVLSTFMELTSMRTPKLLRRSTGAASDYLRTVWNINRSPATLARDAMFGTGPAYTLISDRAYYTPASLDAWAKAQISAPSPKTRMKRRKRTNGAEMKQETGDGARL